MINTKMAQSSRPVFADIFLISLISILLHSCTKDQIVPGDDFIVDYEDHLFGKMKSDFGSHAILKPDSTLWIWGWNLSGQLGNATRESSDIPLRVPIAGKIIDFDMDGEMVVAVDHTGNIWFWGSNGVSSTVWPQILSPIKCSYLSDAVAIGIVRATAYILRNDGSVWQIHIGSDIESSFYEPEPVYDLEKIVSVSQSMALREDGTLAELFSTEPGQGGLVPIKKNRAVENVVVRRTLVLKGDGTVWAWGKNDIGQLADGTFEDHSVPVQVRDLDSVVQISASYDFNLALREDGTVWFWGFTGIWDELHNPIGINTPVKIDNLDNVVSIFAGSTSLVMKKDNTYWSFDCKSRNPRLVSFE
jgi:alpha-tubulin suppressor-like RCC1 family protein